MKLIEDIFESPCGREKEREKERGKRKNLWSSSKRACINTATTREQTAVFPPQVKTREGSEGSWSREERRVGRGVKERGEEAEGEEGGREDEGGN